MKAVVFHGVGEVRVEEVPEPQIKEPTDAIVRLTASSLSGTDLHLVRGSFTGMKAGTILGHEGVGIVEQVGPDVRNLRPGDRVVICPTIGCGVCVYCRDGYYAMCDRANPNGPQAGPVFFGGPEQSGSLPGLQAEKARIPYAQVGLVKLPEAISDEDAVLLSDILPTGYFGAKLAQIKRGNTVAVFGCGPVGLAAIRSASLLGAGLVLAIDAEASRLEMARAQGALTIDFEREDPVEAVRRLTGGSGVDRAIEAVGVDASHPHTGPAAREAQQHEAQFQQEVQELAPQAKPEAGWHLGDAPSQALEWAVQAVAKAGTVAVIGDYPPADRFFPIGQAMNRNLTLNLGHCNHRKYLPTLLNLVRSGVLEPRKLITQHTTLTAAVDAYKAFDAHQEGWVKVELQPVG